MEITSVFCTLKTTYFSLYLLSVSISISLFVIRKKKKNQIIYELFANFFLFFHGFFSYPAHVNLELEIIPSIDLF